VLFVRLSVCRTFDQSNCLNLPACLPGLAGSTMPAGADRIFDCYVRRRVEESRGGEEGRKDGEMERRMEGREEGRMDGWMDGRRQERVSVWVRGCMHYQPTNQPTNQPANQSTKPLNHHHHHHRLLPPPRLLSLCFLGVFILTSALAMALVGGGLRFTNYKNTHPSNTGISEDGLGWMDGCDLTYSIDPLDSSEDARSLSMFDFPFLSYISIFFFGGGWLLLYISITLAVFFCIRGSCQSRCLGQAGGYIEVGR
jgi:hypothetical protein